MTTSEQERPWRRVEPIGGPDAASHDETARAGARKRAGQV